MPKSTKKPKKIYMDYASGVSANPSSIHDDGLNAKNKLEKARKEVASILSCRPNEVIFTSGGTEGNNLAIQGITLSYFFSNNKTLPHIVTTNIEHSSVLETFRLLEKRKLAEVTIVPVEENGIVDSKKVREAIKKNTVLVSVMYANNEIGTIQPIRDIAKEIRHYKKINFLKKNSSREDIGQSFPFFHTDAVQAVNYLDLNVERLGVDLLTLSGAKIVDSGRVGVLYKKSYVKLSPIMGGGDQEFGLRPGTENLEAITKFSEALIATQKIKDKESVRLLKLRNYFISKLPQIFSARGSHSEGEGRRGKKIEEVKIVINGDLENRLPNNVNITIPKIPSDLLVIELSAKGIMTSSKSACKAGDGKASYVIEAIRRRTSNERDVRRQEIDGSIRFSFGRDTTKGDIDYSIKSLKEILAKLGEWYI